ncbi:unnamed protein product [Arctogadus glacialis]
MWIREEGGRGAVSIRGERLPACQPFREKKRCEQRWRRQESQRDESRRPPGSRCSGHETRKRKKTGSPAVLAVSVRATLGAAGVNCALLFPEESLWTISGIPNTGELGEGGVVSEARGNAPKSS